MKLFFKITCIVFFLAICKIGTSQDVGIAVTSPNNGNLAVGQDGFIEVQLVNTSTSVTVPIYKLRPNISVPNTVTINAGGHILPVGWAILPPTTFPANGGAIRIGNGLDATFGPQSTRTILISIRGFSVGVGAAEPITATLQFSNGVSPGTTPGAATPGDNPGNNNASTTIILPITLGDFTATIADCNAKLSWYTLQEVNALKFVVQKSTDAANWQVVTEVRAAGSSAVRRNYTATDNMLEGNKQTQYRLKMVDVDGKISYSSIISIVSTCKVKKVTVYPNPVQNNSFNVFVTGFAEKTTATLRAADGRLVLNKPVREGNNTFNVTNLARGTYFLSVEDTNGNKVKQKVSVIK